MGIRSNKILRNIARIGRTKVSRASSLYSVSAPFVLLVFPIFVSIFFSALICSNTFADSYINLTSSGDVNIDAVRMNPASLTIGKNIVSVDTDSPYGYHIYISAPSEETDSFSPLVLTSDNTVKLLGLNSTTPVAFSSSNDYVNMWGFAVPSDNLSSGSTTNSFSPSASYESLIGTGGTANTSIIYSLTWQGVKSENQEIYTSTDDTNVDLPIYYGVYVDDTAEEGTYTNTVTYTAVVEEPPIDLTIMQNFTAEACAAITTYDEESEFQLTDSRTGAKYFIRHLRDNNCWMVQNLWLPGEMTLTPEDSDITDGYTYTLPVSSTSGYTGSDTNVARMYAASADGTYTSGTGGHIDDEHDTKDTNTGAFFSWMTATAGTGNYYGQTTLVRPVAGNSAQASDSVCPKGWKLPTGGSNGQFQTLYSNSEYNSYANFKDKAWLYAPIGYCHAGSCATQVGCGDLWWSSTHHNSAVVYGLYAYDSAFYLAGNMWDNYKYGGFSIRCVLIGANTTNP